VSDDVMEPSDSTLAIDIQQELRDSFLEYSMSVIVARALPDVRDGLKPVHRRILYAMNESGLTPGPARTRSPRGRWRGHRQSTIPTATRPCTTPWSAWPSPSQWRAPLIDRARATSGPSTATRRRRCATPSPALHRLSMELLRDLDKDDVDFGPNYDESLQEPSLLPSRFPNLLVKRLGGPSRSHGATNIRAAQPGRGHRRDGR